MNTTPSDPETSLADEINQPEKQLAICLHLQTYDRRLRGEGLIIGFRDISGGLRQALGRPRER